MPEFFKSIAIVLAATLVVQPLTAEAALNRPLHVQSEAPIKLLPKLGTIEQHVGSETSEYPHIWLIQDAHTNASGQKSIAAIVEQLNRELNADTVYLEGGYGDASLSHLRNLADSASRSQVANAFLRKGFLNGPEYLNITSDADISLWGVEDENLYDESLGIYRQITLKRDEISGVLEQARSTLEQLKKVIYGPELQEIDHAKRAYADDEIGPTEYFKELAAYLAVAGSSSDRFMHLKHLEELQQMESEIDFKKAASEMTEMIKMIPADQAAEIRISQKRSASDSGKKSSAVNLNLLADRIQEAAGSDKPRKLFPAFYSYLDYSRKAGLSDINALLDEMPLVESAIFTGLMHSENEKVLYEADQALELLERMHRMKVRPVDYSRMEESSFTGLRQVCAVLNGLVLGQGMDVRLMVSYEQSARRFFYLTRAFYALTLKRDIRFIENIARHHLQHNSEHAVLLAGGFHTPNLVKLFQQKDIGYSLIVPSISEETDHSRYERLLLGQSDMLNLSDADADKISLRPAKFRQQPLVESLQSAARLADDDNPFLFRKEYRSEVLDAVPIFADTKHDALIRGELIPALKLLKQDAESQEKSITVEEAVGERSEWFRVIRKIKSDFSPINITGREIQEFNGERFNSFFDRLQKILADNGIPYLLTSSGDEFSMFHVVNISDVPNRKKGANAKVLYVAESASELGDVKSSYFDIRDRDRYAAEVLSKEAEEARKETLQKRLAGYAVASYIPALIVLNVAVAALFPPAIIFSIGASAAVTIAVSYFEIKYLQKRDRQFIRWASLGVLAVLLSLLLYAQQPMPSSDPGGMGDLTVLEAAVGDGNDGDDPIILTMSAAGGAPKSESVEKTDSVSESETETEDIKEPVTEKAVVSPSELVSQTDITPVAASSSAKSSNTSEGTGTGSGLDDGPLDGLFGSDLTGKGKKGGNGQGDEGAAKGPIAPLALGNMKDLGVSLVFDGSGSIDTETRMLFAKTASLYLRTLYGSAGQMGLASFSDEVNEHLPLGAQQSALQINSAEKEFASFFNDFGGGTEVNDTIRQMMTRHLRNGNPNYKHISFIAWDGWGSVDKTLLQTANNRGIDIVFIVVGDQAPSNMPSKSIFLKNPTEEDILFVMRQVLAIKKKYVDQGDDVIPARDGIFDGLGPGFKTSSVQRPELWLPEHAVAGRTGFTELQVSRIADLASALPEEDRQHSYPVFQDTESTSGRSFNLGVLTGQLDGRAVLGARLSDDIVMRIEDPKTRKQSMLERLRNRKRESVELAKRYSGAERVRTDQAINAVSDALNLSGDAALTIHFSDLFYIQNDALLLRLLEFLAIRHHELKSKGRLGKDGKSQIVFVYDAQEADEGRGSRILSALKARLARKSVDAVFVSDLSEIEEGYTVSRFVPVHQENVLFNATEDANHLPVSLVVENLQAEVPLFGPSIALAVAAARLSASGEPVTSQAYTGVISLFNSISAARLNADQFQDLTSGKFPDMLWTYRIKAFAMDTFNRVMKAFVMASRYAGISA